MPTQRPTEPWRPVRGAELPRQSPVFEGRSGGCSHVAVGALLARGADRAGELMVAAAEDAPTPETAIDDRESRHRRRYTYLGQFIDHDLTFDPASSLQSRTTPTRSSTTARRASISTTSTGAARTISLSTERRRTLQLGPAHRQTRATRTRATCRATYRRPAVPSARPRPHRDPRNDENVSSRSCRRPARSQPPRRRASGEGLHEIRASCAGTTSGSCCMISCRPCRVETLARVLPHLKSGSARRGAPVLRFFRWRNEPFIPIEFSAGRLSLRHSMVRPIYRLNTTRPNPPPADDPVNGRLFIFHPEDDANR